MRIASLLPATTEIVAALGRADDLVAITFECDHPPGLTAPVVVRSALDPDLTPGEIDRTVRARAAAGLGMYDLDREALRAAAPDVVLTQDLCGVCALPGRTVADALVEIGLPDVVVHSFDPHTFDEVLTGIAALAAAIDADADGLLADLRRRLDAVADALADAPRPRALVLEWTDPPYLPGHWVPELVRRAGAIPTAAHDGGRSRAVSWDDLEVPEVVVVSPCGYDLDGAVAQAGPVAARYPGVPVVPIDSAAHVVRAGPRLVDGIEVLARALHPECFTGAAPAAPVPSRPARRSGS